MTTILANETRRAEIDGDTVRLYRNYGIKRDAWREFWHVSSKHARRIANAWVFKARIMKGAV